MNNIQSWSVQETQCAYNQTSHAKLCKEHLDPEGFGGRFNIFSYITCQQFNIILRSKAIIKQVRIMISQYLSLSLRHLCYRQILDKFMGIKSKTSHGSKIGTGADVVNENAYSISLSVDFSIVLAPLLGSST